MAHTEHLTLTEICGRKLQLPLTCVVTFEEKGCTVTCDQVPQVYGCGNSKDEAVAMLGREILLMRDDLLRWGNFSEEYRRLGLFLEMVLG